MNALIRGRTQDLLLKIIEISTLLFHICSFSSFSLNLLLIRMKLFDNAFASACLDFQVPNCSHT